MNEREETIRTESKETIDEVIVSAADEAEEPNSVQKELEKLSSELSAAQLAYETAVSAYDNFSLEASINAYVEKGNSKKVALELACKDKQSLKMAVTAAKEAKHLQEVKYRNAERAFRRERQRVEKEMSRRRIADENRIDVEERFPLQMVANMDFDEYFNICRTANNYKAALTYHPIFAGKFQLNDFTGRMDYEKNPITDSVFSKVLIDMERLLGYCNENYLKNALSVVCDENHYNPILEKLDEVTWDGKPRLETFFIDRLGGEDTPLTREMSFRWLCAMVKRLREPACRFDHYIAISDATQGTGKTETFRRLTEGMFGRSYTNDTISSDTDNKDNKIALLASIIGLLDESYKVKFGDNCMEFKQFMSLRHFNLRVPYGRYDEHYDVHHVIAMTTNDENFLTDSSGDTERRAWVIPCKGRKRTPEEWETLNNDEVIRQVWAEADYYYHNQETAPYNIKGDNITILSREASSALDVLQATVKSYNDDYKTTIAISDILVNNSYSKSEFSSCDEFIADNDGYHRDMEEHNEKLQAIPAIWLYQYVSKKTGKTRTGKYIKQVVSSMMDEIGEWVIDNHHYYNGKQTTCFVLRDRKDDVKNFDELLENEAPKTTQKNDNKPKRKLNSDEALHKMLDEIFD